MRQAKTLPTWLATIHARTHAEIVGALDLYPGGDLRLSAGAVWWPTDLTLGATPASSTVSIGSETYSAADVGRLDGVFAVAPVAPYLSLGVGRPGRRVGLYLDFGAAIRTSSEVRITATGPRAGDPAFEADLRVEEEDLRDEIGFFQVYPILAIGVSVTIR